MEETNKDEDGVLFENKKWYGSDINENYLFKNIPLALYRAIEFQQIKTQSKEDLDAQKLIKGQDDLKDLLPKIVSKKTVNLNLKPLLLILGQMHRHEAINTPALAEDLAKIRKMVPAHLTCMQNVALELAGMFAKQQSMKKIVTKNIEVLIEFNQHFIQGMW